MGDAWKGGKYIRLKWYGPMEENQKGLEGKETEAATWEKGKRRREIPQIIAEIEGM